MSAPSWPDLDPELQAWLVEAPGAPAGSSIEVMREYSQRNNGAAFARLTPSLIAPSSVDLQVDGPAGPIPVRVLTCANSAGPTPLVVYFHGGGWVLGDLDTHRAAANRLCVEAGAVVVCVGYRRAPEDRFPAAYDDCAAATQWALAHATSLGADPSLLAVAGDSAGAQLAASVAIGRRDAGEPLAAQLLLYPVIDVAGRYADEANNAGYPSRTAHAGGPGLQLAGMVFFASVYAQPAEAGDWRVSPIAADLHDVAPAVVHTAELDVLRDEGNRYAAKLRSAGVALIAHQFPALNHGYYGLGSVSKAANAASAQAAHDLRELLGLGALILP